jgi:AraC family transcriptional regulator, glycine betaine-responsive activator
MTDNPTKRDFSSVMRSKNSAFLQAASAPDTPVKVGFVLLEHFSMTAFTAAVDALVTANLVCTSPLFEYITMGVNSRMSMSDLGIEISNSTTLEHFTIEHRGTIDILIVCGGFRCSMQENPVLTTMLKSANRQNLMVGGLWNGAVHLAHAGLLDNQECAVHPENHAFIQERFPLVKVSQRALVIASGRATCAGPVSALEMMLELVEQCYDQNIVRAIKEILSCDQVAENSGEMNLKITDNPTFPASLLDLLALMRSNIEEPLSLEELSTHIGISRRQMERLFQTHLETSPSRYYLELRITHARRLLLQSNESITNIAIACGFVSSSHFSNCYKDYFGLSPSSTRQKYDKS